MNDEEGIRRTLALYCHYLDGRQFQEWVNLFTEDGVWAGHAGRKAIEESILAGALAKRPELKRKHMCTNLIIEVDGDTAHASSDYIMFDAVDKEPWAVAGWGHYEDRMVRRQDKWLFVDRTFVR